MKLLILSILAVATAFPQAQTPLTIYQSSGSATGAIRMQERRTNGQNYVGIEAPQSVAANYSLVFPSALPATPSECIKSTTAGVLSFGPCPVTTIAPDYNWTQTITATGAPGAKTITLTPGPLGVAATDTTSQYWLIGTAGASELVVSTGTGTCDGTGQASCTITAITANSHTGATTIQSATAGAQEYWNVAKIAACPSIRLGSGLRQFYGTLKINDCVTVVGDPDGSTAIHANSINAPAISIVYAGVNGRTAYVAGRIAITSIGTHTAGSASVLVEGFTDGGVRGIYCFNPYRCVDWYANNSGGGNPVSISDIRSSGTLHTAVYMRSAGTGHTAGFIDHIYADGAAAAGIRIGGQTAGYTIGDLWFQLINIGISFEQLSGSTLNEITVGAPCLIDGAQSSAINISAATQPGTNGILIHGCFFAMDSGGIPIISDGMERLSIKNNWIRQSGANYAIAVTAGKHVEIAGNTINFENAAGTAYGIGLVTTPSTDVRIADNVMRRVAGAGAATGLLFQALAYTSVDYCDNRFYGLTTNITNTSTSGVTSCAQGAAAAPLTLAMSGSPDVQPLTVRNDAIGALGSCIGMAATDSASSTVYTIGRMCAKFETAAFTDELVTIQTITGSGTFADAISIKNTLVTMPGGIVAGASNISSLVMAGTQSPGFDGLGSIGSASFRYGSVYGYTFVTGAIGPIAASTYSIGTTGNRYLRGFFDGITTGGPTFFENGSTLTLRATNSFVIDACTTVGHVLTAGAAGVMACAAAGGVTAPLTLALGAAGYSEPLTLENPTVGLNGSCMVISGHDSGSTQRQLGRLCGIFESAVYTDELISLMTTTGAGTWQTAMTWKNQAVQIPGTLDITGNLSAAVINATGSPAYRVAGTTVIDASRNATFANLTVSGTCTGCSGLPVTDTTAIIKGSVDATKLLAFEVDGFTTATTRTLTPQNASYTIAGTNVAQTFSGANTFSVGQTVSDLTPATSNTHSSGSAASFWNQMRSETFFVENSGRIRPTTTNTGSVGISTARFNKGWFTDFDITGTITPPSGTAFSGTKTVRASGGLADCTLTFSSGIMTGGTC